MFSGGNTTSRGCQETISVRSRVVPFVNATTTASYFFVVFSTSSSSSTRHHIRANVCVTPIGDVLEKVHEPLRRWGVSLSVYNNNYSRSLFWSCVLYARHGVFFFFDHIICIATGEAEAKKKHSGRPLTPSISFLLFELKTKKRKLAEQKGRPS